MWRSGTYLLFGALLASLLGEAAGDVTCFAGNATYPACFDDTACAGGSCTTTVGCYCADPTTQCLPSSNVTCDSSTNPPTPCCPEGLYWFPGLQCCSEEFNCDPPCAADESCNPGASDAVCQCDKTLYQHANRSQIVPAVDCRGDVMTVSISKCLLERFQYSASNMHLLGNSTECSGVTYVDIVNNERMLFKQVLIQNGYCGTTFSVNGGMVTFTNALYIPPNLTLPTIISSALNIPFSCTYNMTMQTSLLTALHPLFGNVTLPAINGAGSAQAIMAAYTDDAFTKPYEVDYTLTVGSPVYVGIRTTFADGDNFTLRAERCVAAPSTDSYDTDGVDLITDGCALNQDVNALYVHNGDSLEVRFKMDTFVFKDSPEVYIRCDVRLCKKQTPDVCQCGSSQTGRSAGATASLSIGPLDLSVSIDGSGSCTVVSSLAVLWSSLLVLLSLRLF
ncbi:uromodulin-like [Ambystoma mexicanum]|uniref:uromodulin-like n=1 Tax=Ambystoma mexicanum TaxID=8296 RepID=UPI0037E92277